jgi:transcriptional regulator with PAS, ATPase and Fis domain
LNSNADLAAGGKAPEPSLPIAMEARLPGDADGILALAAREMFSLFSSISQGMLLVDKQGRVVWINEGYRKFLPELGFARDEDFVGRLVEEVIPNTLMHQVLDTGKPILIDLLTNMAGTFVVSRIPLRDPQGQVIGALGMVLFDHPETTLQPLIEKFAGLQKDLDDARRELAAQRRTKYTFGSFVGNSAASAEVKRQGRRAALTNSTVLLTGETGTGKELLAHAIHAASARALRPFIGVNIAAVPESLIEAEFFGVAPGAYTGADRKGRDGKFKVAEGGTLFLDEIGDMPLGLQSKLLRVLQEQEYEPVGSNALVRTQVRIIAATSRDLPAMVAAGQFREDLYYRLNVLTIRMPALRERVQDLPALVEALSEDIARRSGLPQREVSDEALALLSRHPWRGNIRELRNLLEQASLLSDTIRLGVTQIEPLLHGQMRLPSGTPHALASATVTPPAPVMVALKTNQTLPELIADIERQAIAQALAESGGNKLAAAKRLGIARATLYQKLGETPSD